MKPIYGGIEAGGTKFVCMAASGPDEIIAETRFPTTQPGETIQKAVDFFAPFLQRGELKAIGIGSFGPVDLDPASPTYGYITTTPKPGWAQTDLRGGILRAFDLPVAFETDVNAAAIGEHSWTPENSRFDPFLYVTVGTGIGVGVIANGRPLHGLVHPEMGHFPLPHDWRRDPFPGVCPYHGDCFEGLATGPSMKARWGQPAETLPDDHPGWDLEAEYIALGLVDMIYAYSPMRIVLGGGVAQHPGLHERIRGKVLRILNGYVRSPAILERIDDYIIPPTLGGRSGVLGAIALAIKLLGKKP
ncbi:MAG: ROK family protein [Anaerolineales bacterium]|nr:ROK family protein [Anaerolineales bacterium]